MRYVDNIKDWCIFKAILRNKRSTLVHRPGRSVKHAKVCQSFLSIDSHTYGRVFFVIRYLKLEHSRHCVPSNVSSGFASLPLKYIWFDGQANMSFPTTQTLPTGERLNGSWAYSQILSYFTTNQMTPLEVHELGKKQLDILYPKVRKIKRYKINKYYPKVDKQ